tara:strand:- start:1372 stop:1572 length:201 start_codon:yes stop_codon:yes gene_type:complete
MNLKISQFPILNKESNVVEYVKDVYKKRIQSEADSFFNQEERPDTMYRTRHFVCRSNFNLVIENSQ